MPRRICADYPGSPFTVFAVDLGLGDINLKSYLIIEKAVHTFESGRHTMDLTLVGGERGEFIG